MKSLLRCLAVATLSLAGPAWAASPLDGAGQVVVVTSEGWDSTHGRLQAFTRSGSGWKPEGAAFDVALGRSGSAWGIGLHPAQAGEPQKREGDGRAPAGFAPLAIGLALALIHLISIPVTNTSVNPARSTGVALFVGDWALGQLWLFWVAPIVGAILGALAYRAIATKA